MILPTRLILGSLLIGILTTMAPAQEPARQAPSRQDEDDRVRGLWIDENLPSGGTGEPEDPKSGKPRKGGPIAPSAPRPG